MDKAKAKRTALVGGILFMSVFGVIYAGYLLVYVFTPVVQRAFGAVFFLLTFVAFVFNAIGCTYFYQSYKENPPITKAKNHEPTIAVVVPVYNEEPADVAKCLATLKKLKYPEEKLRFYILDDSTKPEVAEELRDYAKANDWEFIHRDKREGFKAGAFNNFLKQSKEDFIAIFDSDEQLFDPAFLEETLPLFDDPKVGMVQTAKRVPAKSLLARSIDASYAFFFNFIQPARSRDDMAMFCGSAGIVRRKCIDDVGGFPLSLTEDAALSFKADMRGWKGKYISKTYAWGKPIESYSGFATQQWRYVYGNAGLLPEYLANLRKFSLRKQFHYMSQMFGFTYLSLAFILFAIVTLVLVSYNLSAVSLQFSHLFSTPETALQINGVSFVPILATLVSFLLISKLYFGSMRVGAIAYFLNFAISFVRSRAAIDALRKKTAIFRIPHRGKKTGMGVIEAFRATKFETAFSVILFGFAFLSMLSLDFIGAFWVYWYSFMFSSAFILARTFG